MNTKRIVSLVVGCLGIIMVIYAISSMRRISEAKGTVQNINSKISNSSIGRMMGGELESEASQYDTKVRILLISGIVLTVAGCGGAYVYRKHRR